MKATTKAPDFTNFYLVSRLHGTSYQPQWQGEKFIGAISNKATENSTKHINIQALIKGLKERRWRLVPKTI